ncbi:MAG TPA: alpha/beta fold hydrolase [Burkholderiaceae bacterium]|nr:alpha/beta fold hydrolase [Burkholderiaceae bacterium]
MTLATFLRLGLFLQTGIVVALALWLLPSGYGWLALPIAAFVPLAVNGVALAFEFAVGAAVDPRTPRLPLRDRLAIWWEETLVSTRMFSFSQLFAARFPEPPLVRDPQRPAVLLVHGYLCNRAVWRALLDSGTLGGCNVATVNLEPIFGPIERYADVINGAVDRLRAATGATQVVLVGHSMGGLAIRAYLRSCSDAAVARVITLATPHHGTALAPLGTGANAKQMRIGSRFTTELEQALSPAVVAKFACIATRDDNLIVPRTSPLVRGAQHIVVERVGHLALLEDERAWQAIHDAVHAMPDHGLVAPRQRVIDSAT